MTKKRYNIELYLQWPTNRKSYYGLSNGAIFNDLEQPLINAFSRSLFFAAEYLINGYRYGHSYYRRKKANRKQHEWYQFGYLQ